MGNRTYYKSGDNNVICDRCGFKYKASEVRKTWDGLWVCKKDWEPRHPQDFVRSRPDDQTVAINRPRGTATFVDEAVALPAASTTIPEGTF